MATTVCGPSYGAVSATVPRGSVSLQTCRTKPYAYTPDPYRLPYQWKVEGREVMPRWGEYDNTDFTAHKAYGTMDGLSKYRQEARPVEMRPLVFKAYENQMLPSPVGVNVLEEIRTIEPTCRNVKQDPRQEVFPYHDASRLDANCMPALSRTTRAGLRDNFERLLATSTSHAMHRDTSDAIRELTDKMHARKALTKRGWYETRRDYLTSAFPHLAGTRSVTALPTYPRLVRLVRSTPGVYSPEYEEEDTDEAGLPQLDECPASLRHILHRSLIPTGAIFDDYFAYKRAMLRSPLMVDLVTNKESGAARHEYPLAEPVCSETSTRDWGAVPSGEAERYIPPWSHLMDPDDDDEDAPDADLEWRRRLRFKYETYNPGLEETFSSPALPSPSTTRELPRPRIAPKSKTQLQKEYHDKYTDPVPDQRQWVVWPRKRPILVLNDVRHYE